MSDLMAEAVLICIPTFKRPRMLRRLLDAIAALQTDARISVLVADNDAESHPLVQILYYMVKYENDARVCQVGPGYRGKRAGKMI